ncbi:MAG: methyltransferase domain-containing protein [Dehalococcoidia bacterium]|nr:methyltransferase domain-containing protein [Dehalococcoidia bacterium]
MSQDQLEAFSRRMHPRVVAVGRDLVARYDFSSHRNLLDVAGGTGGLAIAVTAACPHIRATVVDLPDLTPVTRRFVTEAQAADRIQVVTADVVSGPVTGSFDVEVMSSFIQVLSAAQARCAIRNVSEVIEPGGWLYIVGSVLDNSRLSPQEIMGSNLFFLNHFDEGQACTEQAHRDWLTEAGFVDVKRVVLPNKSSIVTARKPG